MEFAAQLAREIGRLLLGAFKPQGTPATLKEDLTLVTEADVAADQRIAKKIKENYPEDLLISEELQPRLPKDAPPGGRAWVVDPLDGTTNFSLGLPIWGVSIALLAEGWPKLAALYFPIMEELYTAQIGSGAFLNGERIHAKGLDPDKPAPFFSCCSRTFRNYDVGIRYKPRILGSAAFNLCAVARGMAVIAFEATPKIWDIAGGWLVVSEAGGIIETYDGSQPFPVLPGQDYRAQSFPTIAAATEALAAEAHQKIRRR